MPNHITNRLKIIGTDEQITKVRSEIKGEDENQFIDFNKIAPMPKELENTQSPLRIISQEEYDEQEKRLVEDDFSDTEKRFGISRGLTKELADEYMSKFGYAEWYGWQSNNWGTKWNAYGQTELDADELEFDTAWSTPYKIMLKLSEKYPDVTFDVQYADEDFGYNVGTYTLMGGELLDENIPKGGTVEAIQMAMDIKGDEDYYLFEYLYNEDDNLSEFAKTLVGMVHIKGILDTNYPKSVLDKLKELALADEQFERVVEIDKLLDKVNTEN